MKFFERIQRGLQSILQSGGVGIISLRVLLALNETRGAMTGSEIWTEYEKLTNERIHSGGIYATIRRLRDRGYVLEISSGRYKITDSARDALQQGAQDFEEVRQIMRGPSPDHAQLCAT